MTPTIGRIVVYKTTDEDKEFMRNNSCNVQDELPAIIVAVWGEEMINAKVITDGTVPFLWKTSIHKGELIGEWNFPVIK